MHITFPMGKRVTFNYEGKHGLRRAHANPGGVAPLIDKPPATHPRKDGTLPLLQRVSVYESSSAETIEYIDPVGSEM